MHRFHDLKKSIFGFCVNGYFFRFRSRFFRVQQIFVQWIVSIGLNLVAFVSVNAVPSTLQSDCNQPDCE